MVIDQLKQELSRLAHEKVMQEELTARVEAQGLRNKERAREWKAKVQELEGEVKRLSGVVMEKDREVERERNGAKVRGQKLEGKL